MRSSSYNFMPIFLKLYKCFCHGLKMCMWFGYNPQINYTPGIYAEGYIVFVFLFVSPSVRMFVCSFVHSFVRSFVLPSRSWNYFKVLRASNSSGEYLTNHLSESIHIWTIGTWRVGFHSMTPHPRVHAPGWG